MILFGNLPPELKKMIFQFLTLDDLKMIRLVSNRLSQEVRVLDKRFKVYTVRSCDNLPQVCHDSNITVCLKEVTLLWTAGELSQWLVQHSPKISELRMFSSEDSYSVAREIVKPGLEFPMLEKVKLDLDVSCDTRVDKLLMKFGPHIEVLRISDGDFRNMETQGPFDLSSLKVATFHPRMNLNKLLRTLTPAANSLLELDIDEGFCVVDLPVQLNALQHLKISNCTFERDQLKELISRNSHNLQSLFIDHVNVIGNDILNLDFGLASLHSLTIISFELHFWLLASVLMSTLTELHLQNVDMSLLDQQDHQLPALKKVSLIQCGSARAQTEFLSQCPNLEELASDTRVTRDLSFPKLTTAILSDATGDYRSQHYLINSCRLRLECLQLNCYRHSYYQRPSLKLFDGRRTNRFPALRKLSLTDCYFRLDLINKQCPNLESLSISNSYPSDNTQPAATVKHLKIEDANKRIIADFIGVVGSSLETLMMRGIEFSVLECIKDRLPNLRRFCLDASDVLIEERMKPLVPDHVLFCYNQDCEHYSYFQ